MNELQYIKRFLTFDKNWYSLIKMLIFQFRQIYYKFYACLNYDNIFISLQIILLRLFHLIMFCLKIYLSNVFILGIVYYMYLYFLFLPSTTYCVCAFVCVCLFLHDKASHPFTYTFYCYVPSSHVDHHIYSLTSLLN